MRTFYEATADDQLQPELRFIKGKLLVCEAK